MNLLNDPHIVCSVALGSLFCHLMVAVSKFYFALFWIFVTSFFLLVTKNNNNNNNQKNPNFFYGKHFDTGLYFTKSFFFFSKLISES